MILNDRPAGYWRMGEMGASTFDQTGFGQTGTYTGSPSKTGFPGLIAGDSDRSMYSTSGGYVSVADSVSNSLVGQFSLEAWFNTQVATQQQAIIEKYSPGYLLRIVGVGSAKLRFQIIGGANPSVDSVADVIANRVYHVVGVYDGAKMRIHINGRLNNTSANTVAAGDGSGTMKIGARGDDAATGFVGVLDECAIYNRALTDVEIANHYRVGTNGESVWLINQLARVPLTSTPPPPPVAAGNMFRMF